MFANFASFIKAIITAHSTCCCERHRQRRHHKQWHDNWKTSARCLQLTSTVTATVTAGVTSIATAATPLSVAPPPSAWCFVGGAVAAAGASCHLQINCCKYVHIYIYSNSIIYSFAFIYYVCIFNCKYCICHSMLAKVHDSPFNCADNSSD